MAKAKGINAVKERTSRLQNSKVIALTLAIIIVGYVFFFMSGIIFPHKTNYYLTELNQPIDFDSRKITVIKTQYSREQNLVEIQMDVSNPTYDGLDTYICQAITRNNLLLPINPIIEENNFLVYHITVPKKFTEISIRLKVADDRHTEMLKIYTNIKDIDKTEFITTKSAHEYKVERFESNINIYNAEIQDLEQKITDCENVIANIENTNTKLADDRIYQTDQEIIETNNAIAQNEQRIKEERDKINDYNDQIKELVEKIRKTKERIKEL